MEKEILALININRDAIPTNRGFYFQYLNVVSKWIHHYINNVDIDIYTEVDDDIKEVGNELMFTQLKCYTSAFSFKSEEIRKSVFNFFSLYLQYYKQAESLTFNFTTNTSISGSENLLEKWISEQPPVDEELQNLCISKVSKVLQEEITVIRNRRLAKKKLTLSDKEKLNKDFDKLDAIVQDTELVSDFVKRIRWEFGEIHSEDAVQHLASEILESLGNPIFAAHPAQSLLDAMLSEVYRRSQLSDPAERKVNSALLQSILSAKDTELSAYIDHRLITLFNFRLDIIENDIKDIKDALDDTVTTQKQQGVVLDQLIEAQSREKETLPKQLTKIPYIDPFSVIGREELLFTLHQLLSDVRQVSLHGEGAMGKSTLLKLYVDRYHNEYDHIIWLSTESGLVNTLTLNPELSLHLNSPISASDQFSERFDLILGKLNKITGNNLLVIDGYSNIEPQMADLRSLKNWHIMVGTRLRLEGWKTLPIKPLSFESAKTLYFSFNNHTDVSDLQLKTLFNLVDYNTLIITLVAKMINYSFDLSLDYVITHFQQQSLDDKGLQIALPDENGNSRHLLHILNATFDLSRLDPEDEYYIRWLALLPLADTDFADLVDWFGPRSKEENRIALTNVINSLHAKGLIERSGKQISMHKMLRDSILYQERKDENAFDAQFFNINCLTARIKEGADRNLSQALRFLKYGEAILSAIKEPYRKKVYHQLLMLENEVLHIYNWMQKHNDLTTQWKDLYDRAEKYLPKDDSLLGIISNNYGLALAADGDWTQDSGYFEKAISILQSLDTKVLPQLFLSLCNLCHLFIKQRDLQRFHECFETLQNLRTEHNLWNDASLPVQCQLLALAYYEGGNFPEAIRLLNWAINLHEELPAEQKNDAYLVYYFIKIGESYLMNKEPDKAEKAANMALNKLYELKANGLGLLPQILRLMITIAELNEDYENAEKLKKILDDLR